MNQVVISVILLLVSIGSIAEVSNVSNLKSNEPNKAEYNVLFVGNSLTYTNNLPQLVVNHAATKGITVTAQMLAKPNYAIIDHWADGQVQNLIRNNQFDFVIIQQGPSSQQDGYQMLINGGADYAQICEQNNTRLAYFMVWPSIINYHTFDGVINNYTAGAEANNAILIPVGSVWKQYIAATGNYSYYGPDGFHPSSAGSQMAAEVIVKTLFSKPSFTCHANTKYMKKLLGTN